ncbi:MAG TPA: hypothetical protein VJN95_15175 [Gemmatimonadales bacterium]|nr:hypothetical protein [Gemmatimonadales bacterium]
MDAISWLIVLLAGALVLFLLAVRRRDRRRDGVGGGRSPMADASGTGFLDDSAGSHHGHDGHGAGHGDGGAGHGDGGAGHGGDGGGGGHH